jgi:hypothetical protein
MNPTEVSRTSYDAPVRIRDTDKMYRDAMQDPKKRIGLIQYLREHGLLSAPWGLRDE